MSYIDHAVTATPWGGLFSGVIRRTEQCYNTLFQMAGIDLVWIISSEDFAVFVCTNRCKYRKMMEEVTGQFVNQVCGTNMVSNSTEKIGEI